MIGITLRQLEYLVAVAEEGSLAAGAAHCHVSPMAVGQALDDLESSLGVRLTRRQRSRGVEITAVGQTVVAQARKVMRSAETLPLIANAAANQMATVLRIGTFPTLSGWTIPPIVAEFATHHPEVNIELIEADYPTLHADLREGRLDLAVALLTHVQPGIKTIQVSPASLRILCSLENPLSQRNEVYLRELANEDLAILSVYPVSELLNTLLKENGIASSVRWRTENIDVIKNLVGRNLAVSPLVSPGLSLTSNEGADLTGVRVADPLPDQGVVACLPGDTPIGPAQRIAVDALRRHSQQG